VTATVVAAAPTATELPPSPYRGLRSYAVEDAAFFFGREAEREIIAANLLGVRLTLLYGPSGVGKSSVLLAGVVSDLRERSRQNLADEDAAGFAVVVVRDWSDPDPLQAIAAALRAEASALLEREDLPEPASEATLAEVLDHWSAQVRGKLLVVFDQFEEYFLYHERESGPGTFDAEFPQAVNRADLRTDFLLSIRDDALARLDRFKGRIPNLFENRLQIDHLTLAAARDAVRLPIEEYNRRAAPEQRVEIEDELVDDVLEQVRTGRVSLESAGAGASALRDHVDAEARVETPILQVVLTALWEKEAEMGSRTLRAQTLVELGGAQQLVRDRLDERMNRLDFGEQEIAADVARFLVTPSGTKIAYTAADLAAYAELEPRQVEPVLEKLAERDARILRPVQPMGGQGPTRYEIFHDILGPAILNWRARRVEERGRAAAEKRARRERRKALLSYGIAAFSLLIAVGVAALSYWALQERRSARAQRYVADAIAALPTDPHQSAKLAEQALDTKATPAAESAFRVAVSQSRLLAAVRHPSSVYTAAYSGDGKLILSMGGKDARVWDAKTGRTLDVFGYGERISQASFVPHSNRKSYRVITAGWDGTVRLWTPGSKHVRPIVPPMKQSLTSAAASPDGRQVLAVDIYGRAKLVDLGSRRSQSLGRDVAVAGFSPDGKLIVTGSNAGVLRFRPANPAPQGARTGTNRVPRSVTTGEDAIQRFSFDRSGRFLVAVSADSKARVYRVSDGRLVGRPLSDKRLSAAVFSPDGKVVATVAGKLVHLWDVATGKPLGTLRGHDNWVNDVAFSPDGTLIATASGDATARVWETATRAELLALRGSRGAVNTVQFSPDGRSVVTASVDGTARTWNIATGVWLHGFHVHKGWVLDAEFSPDGRIFTAGEDHALMVWNGKTGEYITRLAIPAEAAVSRIAFDPSPKRHRFVMAVADGTAIIRSTKTGNRLHTIDEAARAGYSGTTGENGAALNTAVFSPDGKRVLTASADWTASIWNAATAKHIKTLVPPAQSELGYTHLGTVTDAAYSPDGRFIVTTGGDQLAQVWTAEGKWLRTFDGHHANLISVAFDPKPRSPLVVTTSDDATARVWDVTTGKELVRLDAGVPLSDAAFSPDEQLIAGVSTDGVTRIWRWRRHELLAAMPMHADFANSVAFSRDGRWILTASDDHTAKLYRCDTCGTSLKDLRKRVGLRERPLAALDR
jgi:WD40 repeat protein